MNSLNAKLFVTYLNIVAVLPMVFIRAKKWNNSLKHSFGKAATHNY